MEWILILHKFNFVANIVNIKSCYTSIESCISTEWPISTPLYILAETLAEAVWVESDFKGVKLVDELISKWVGYSDDRKVSSPDLNHL